MQNYWHKQTVDKPLFPDLLWSRPQNTRQAGKLLIIGGNSFGFAAPGEAYRWASEAGGGLTRVLLPFAVKKVAGALLQELEFAASTPSGSFAKDALGEWLAQASWADGVLLAGDLGRNSETAILLESFLAKHSGQATITKDAADYILAMPEVLDRSDTLLVITMAQLQKLAVVVKFPTAFTLSMDLLHMAETLHEFTNRYPVHIIVKHYDVLLVASAGQVSTTPAEPAMDMWRVKAASYASVWWLQNPDKPFESLTTAITWPT